MHLLTMPKTTELKLAYTRHEPYGVVVRSSQPIPRVKEPSKQGLCLGTNYPVELSFGTRLLVAISDRSHYFVCAVNRECYPGSWVLLLRPEIQSS